MEHRGAPVPLRVPESIRDRLQDVVSQLTAAGAG